MTSASVAAATAAIAFLMLTRARPTLVRSSPRPAREAAPVATRWWARLRRSPSARAADVPLAADLVVAGLEAGVPLWAAVEAAGDAVGGELGSLLVEVRRRHALGADAATATAVLAAHEDSARMARALAAAGSSGASPVHVLAAAAAAERDGLRSAAVSKARTAGSLAALPVGLLFLPAFVLVAVVPIVVGSLGSLLGSP